MAARVDGFEDRIERIRSRWRRCQLGLRSEHTDLRGSKAAAWRQLETAGRRSVRLSSPDRRQFIDER